MNIVPKLEAVECQMDLSKSIQLIFLCVVNIFFTFCGILLNSLVVLSFIKSSQLRKKLCYFMIMILSCIDLLTVATNHPLAVTYSIVCLSEKYDVLPMLSYSMRILNTLPSFSLLALFVMSIDRYLAMAHPLFHRVSVTKRRLLCLLAALCVFYSILAAGFVHEFLITPYVAVSIFFGVISPPFFLINCKLLMIVKRERRTTAESRNATTIVKLKNISTCLLAVACFALLSIPVLITIGIHSTGQGTSTSGRLSWLWALTVMCINSTFNCLIFYWRNKILRLEGKKLLKSLMPSIFGKSN